MKSYCLRSSSCPIPLKALGKIGAGLLLGLLGACGVTESDVRLATQTIQQDFGMPRTEVLPTIPCFAGFDLCSMVQALDSRIRGACDLDQGHCYADLNLTVLIPVDFSKDIAFQSGIAQREADSVRDIDMSYGMTNDLTFDVDSIDLYVGPEGSLGTGSPGVVAIGVIDMIARGQSIPDDQGHILIEDGSPAHALLVERIRHPEETFLFLMVPHVQFRPSDPYPAGSLEVRLTPVVTLLDR